MTAEELIISLAVNLIAAFLWWSFFALVGGKTKIDYLITISLDCARQFEDSIEYNDYDNACRQADRLIDLTISISDAIKPLTYLPKKAKLFRTFTYSAFRIESIFQSMTIGYSGTQEKEKRCQKYKRHFSNSIKLDEDYLVSHLSFTYEILHELNRVKSVRKALLGVPTYRMVDVTKKHEVLTDNLIYLNAFKNDDGRNDDFISSSVFTQSLYNDYIAKKIKSR